MTSIQCRCFLWFFSVYVLMEFTHSDQQINTFIEWAKRMDRGRYSGPFQLQSDSFKTLNEYKKRFYQDLWCSYAVSATVHMHLTETFLANENYRKMLSVTEMKSLTFTDEASQILKVVFNDEHDGNWYTLADIMWIFLMYAELAHEYLHACVFNSALAKQAVWLSSDRTENNKNVLKIHRSVIKVLEEFIKSQCCQVFDPITKKQVTDVASLVETRTNDATDLNSDAVKQSLLIQVDRNRQKFDEQNEHNYKLDQRFDHRPIKRYSVSDLLLCRMLDNENDNIKIFEKFGIQLDLNPIEYQLRYYYGLGSNRNNSLYVRIKWIITFQEKCVHLIKVVAIRIIIRYLLNIKLIVDNILQKVVLNQGELWNRKLVEYLNSLAKHFNITDDEHLRPAINVIANSNQKFSNHKVIDKNVNILLLLLKFMSPDGYRFDKPVYVDREDSIRTMENVNVIAKEYGLYTPEEITGCPVNEPLLSAKVLVEYVKHILTPKVDFFAMKSFTKLESSESYKRLKQLEIDDHEDLILL